MNQRAEHQWHGYNCPCACCNGFCDHDIARRAKAEWEAMRRTRPTCQVPVQRRPLRVTFELWNRWVPMRRETTADGTTALYFGIGRLTWRR